MSFSIISTLNSIKFQCKRNFLASLIALQLIVVISNQFISSYFNIKVLEMISFTTQDGHCDGVNRKGLGEHCFGDFFYGFMFANSDNPYTTEYFNAYPPFALFLLKPFIFINNLFPGSLFSIIIYLVTNLFCVLYATRVITRDMPQNVKMGFFLVSFCSAPVIVALDRGNNVVYLFLLYSLFLESMTKNKVGISIVLGTVMTLLKPQMLLLCLVYLNRNRMGVLIKFLTLSLTLFVMCFLLYPKSFPANILDWLQSSGEYQRYSGTSILPVNISLSNFLGLVNTFREYVSSGQLEMYSLSMTTNIVLMFSLASLVAIKLGIAKNGTYNIVERNLLVVLLIILAPGTTFHYYFLLLVPFIPHFFAEKTPNSTKSIRNELQFDSKVTTIFALLMFLILPCWGFPARLIFPGFTTLDISLHWQVANFVTIILFFLLLIMRKRNVVAHNLIGS